MRMYQLINVKTNPNFETNSFFSDNYEFSEWNNEEESL